MKHNLNIRVSRPPVQGGLVSCQKISIRERILSALFGPRHSLMVLVPGGSVESIAITETEGGSSHE